MNTPERLDLDAVSRQALEFDALLEIVTAEAKTDAGKRAVRALSPLTGRDRLERENSLVAEETISLEDLDLIVGTDDVEEAIRIIQGRG